MTNHCAPQLLWISLCRPYGVSVVVCLLLYLCCCASHCAALTVSRLLCLLLCLSCLVCVYLTVTHLLCFSCYTSLAVFLLLCFSCCASRVVSLNAGCRFCCGMMQSCLRRSCHSFDARMHSYWTDGCSTLYFLLTIETSVTC